MPIKYANYSINWTTTISKWLQCFQFKSKIQNTTSQIGHLCLLPSNGERERKRNEKMNRFEENAIKAVFSRSRVKKCVFCNDNELANARINIFGDKIGSQNEAWVIITLLLCVDCFPLFLYRKPNRFADIALLFTWKLKIGTYFRRCCMAPMSTFVSSLGWLRWHWACSQRFRLSCICVGHWSGRLSKILASDCATAYRHLIGLTQNLNRSSCFTVLLLISLLLFEFIVFSFDPFDIVDEMSLNS